MNKKKYTHTGKSISANQSDSGGGGGGVKLMRRSYVRISIEIWQSRHPSLVIYIHFPHLRYKYPFSNTNSQADTFINVILRSFTTNVSTFFFPGNSPNNVTKNPPIKKNLSIRHFRNPSWSFNVHHSHVARVFFFLSLNFQFNPSPHNTTSPAPR